ncbi:MAG: class I SAM-dependent methyltransferase [Pseudomonadota bacterium]
MSATTNESDEVNAGQAVYSPLTLAFYDLIVLGVSNAWIWRCPTKRLRALYDRNAKARHLDIGVGTGYFLDTCKWPVPNPEIALADLNLNSLQAAAKRIARYAPTLQQHNVFEEFSPAEPFDSVGLNFLLHCLPGDGLLEKATIFDSLRNIIAPSSRVFGSTITYDAAHRSGPATWLMSAYNRRGVFSNKNDLGDDLIAGLESRFATVATERYGSVLLFEASGYKSA